MRGKELSELIPLMAVVTCSGAPLAMGQEAGAIRVDTVYTQIPGIVVTGGERLSARLIARQRTLRAGRR